MAQLQRSARASDKVNGMTLHSADKIPKKIWIMWLQGLEQAPRVVKECYKTWATLNPDWEVIFLDETNLSHYIDLNPFTAKQPLMEKAALSDIVRAKLLAQHGGVWVDATCYCRKPLNEWLEEVTASGFFAFYKPVEQSLVAVWFLAVNQNNRLMARRAEAAEAYVLRNPNLAQRPKTRRWFKWLMKNTTTTRYWFSYPLRRIFKTYPYYWFMFLFAEVIRKDEKSRRIWEQTPKLRPPNPGRLHKNKLLTPLTEELKEEIDNGEAPVYKLTWRYDSKDYSENCVLEYILVGCQYRYAK